MTSIMEKTVLFIARELGEHMATVDWSDDTIEAECKEKFEQLLDQLTKAAELLWVSENEEPEQ